jgi:adenylate cyclase
LLVGEASVSQIFISYARSTEPAAHLIAESLRALGYGVWRDDELPPHRAYAEVIEERLRAAKAVIVVWSSDAVRSQWVRAEADLAREQSKLVQLSLDGATPPLPFNQIHCVDLAGWSGNLTAPGWRKIVDTVADLLKQAPEDTAEAPPLPDKPSVAVLPFDSRGGNTDQDYFVDGMVDEIVSALTRIRSLFVIASSATMSLRNLRLDPQSAARRLGVRYVLEGSVSRSGSQVRIAVKLTDAARNVQIWADHFDDSLEDIFALQDRVALSVAGIIEPNIRTAELGRVARSRVENLGCYDLYLRAAHLRATLRKAEVIQALELLNRALSMHSEFGPALAQAAGCHSQIYVNHWADDRDAHRRAGLEMAERAVHAGGEDSAVLAQVANAIMDLGPENLDRATRLIERATILNPGSAYAWFISGFIKIMNGNGDDAVAHLQRAARLDPVSPLHEIARAHIGVGMLLQGNFEEALRILRGSNYRPRRIQLALFFVHARLDQWQEAREQLDLLEKGSGSTAESIVNHSTPRLRAMLLEAIVQARKWKPQAD